MTDQKLNWPWILKMAWRDSRKNRSRLFLFVSAIILGIAALVAVYSFDHNLRKDIDGQAAGLIGADLVLDSRKPPDQQAQQVIDSLKELSIGFSEERSFASMLFFPANKGTRLVEVRALKGNFPFYGKLETRPASASLSFRNKKEALLDKTLMLQFHARVGDSVHLGNGIFRIAGILENVPGRTGIASAVAPAVFIPLAYLEATGLLQKGSRINYSYYYRFPNGFNTGQLVQRLDDRLGNLGFDVDTVAMRKENTGRTFSDMTGFLALVGFIALLLGCIGVSGSVHIYIREKITSIAVLRCLGASSTQAFLIFLVQIASIGLLGSVIGAVLGIGIQQLLPLLLQNFLPIRVSNDISWWAIIQGIYTGVLVAVLFALVPLVGIREISPLNTLRIAFEKEKHKLAKLTQWVYLLIAAFVLGFARLQLGSWQQALIFTGGALVAFALLYGLALVLLKALRRYFPASWSYVWRQGLANLFRPNNQTAMLIIAIGLGTAFIATLFFVQDMLLGRVKLSTSGNQPNMVIFDIQSAQKDSLASLTRKLGLPVLQEVPVVTIQLQAVNGYTIADVKKDSSLDVPERAFRGELRVTYRDSLTVSEKLTDGSWQGIVGPNDTAKVSLEKDYAIRSGIKIGDRLIYNVQGRMVPAIVGSLREVDWNRIQTNFRVVFPKGVIDDAPQFHVLITRTPNDAISVRFQQQLVQRFPNVSIIDLSLVLGVLDEILEKVGFVIRFMAGLSICTGLVVLIAAIMISKYQRMQESVLLRTMGASRKQIWLITLIEYVFLGFLAALAGIVLALTASWALAIFNFETSFIPNPFVILGLITVVTLLSVFIGLLNSRGVLNKPPLEILRK